MASHKSRQEFTPVMDIFSTKSYCEPLHIQNLAWYQWNQKLLKTVLELMTAPPPQKGTISDGSSFAKYLRLLKEHQLTKLALKISSWYLEPSRSSTLNIRFTGEERKEICWCFVYSVTYWRWASRPTINCIRIYWLESTPGCCYSLSQKDLKLACNNYYVASCLFSTCRLRAQPLHYAEMRGQTYAAEGIFGALLRCFTWIKVGECNEAWICRR